MSEKCGKSAGWFLLGLLLTVLSGCVKNEFKVEVELEDGVEGHFTFMYYASDPEKGWLVEEVVLPDKGKLEFTGKTRFPTLVYVFTRGHQSEGIFYAERGDRLTVSKGGSQPNFWQIKGNSLSEGLSEWRIANKEALAAGGKKINEAVARYVEKNRENPVAALLLLLYYERGADEPGFRRLWDSLEGKAASGEWTRLAGRLDVETSGSFPTMPKQILLNSMEHGLDTIRPGRVPILLYFASNGVDGRAEDIKRLRQLTRDWGDSSKRIIAEIGLDPDSGSRSWPVRRDSLKTVIHAWMPLGLSDSIPISLGVGSIPRFVVIDRKGKAVYNGRHREAAAGRFEAEMKK